MLVMSRKNGDWTHFEVTASFDGHGAEIPTTFRIKVERMHSGAIRMTVDAPMSVKVKRPEARLKEGE